MNTLLGQLVHGNFLTKTYDPCTGPHPPADDLAPLRLRRRFKVKLKSKSSIFRMFFKRPVESRHVPYWSYQACQADSQYCKSHILCTSSWCHARCEFELGHTSTRRRFFADFSPYQRLRCRGFLLPRTAGHECCNTCTSSFGRRNRSQGLRLG